MTFRFFALLGAFLFAIPRGASACAVCFGGADSNLATGFFWGILILLVLPFAMTAGFIVTLARTARRKRTS